MNQDRRLPLVDSFLGIGVAFGRCLFWAEFVPRKRKQTKPNVSRLVKRVPALPLVSVDSVPSSLRDCRSSISSLNRVATTRTAASRAAFFRVFQTHYSVYIQVSRPSSSIAPWIQKKTYTCCTVPKKVMMVGSTEAARTPARFREWLSQLMNFAFAFPSRSLVCTPLI